MRCRLKCHNERNPCCQLLTGDAEDSDKTAIVRCEEGGDDVKSARPLRPGLHTCYNGGYRGPLPREWMPIPKTSLSSDWSLQPDSTKLDSLVIAHTDNTDIIRWEAMYEANGESRVTRMIEQFSKLCRMGMRTGGNTIPLSEGLEHAKVYLEVINFRHQDKIELSVSIKPDVRDCYIPQFMLQPIMENAVVHGFNDAAKGCQIEILVTNWEEKLKIVVKDNGKGMTEEEQKQLQKQIDEEIQSGKNIGMANVNQRIRLFYGEEYGIQMESRQGEGTEVEIILPIRKYSENMKNLSGEEKEDDLSGSDCR